MITRTDPRNEVTTYGYDDAGRLTSEGKGATHLLTDFSPLNGNLRLMG
jgi:hypothetical protein